MFLDAQRQRAARGRVGVPYPVPMFPEDFDRDESREPTDLELRAYFDTLGEKHRGWGEYITGYRTLPYIQKIFNYMVSINMDYETAKNLVNIDEAYEGDEAVFRARQSEVAGFVRKLIRGATGYEYYSYFGLLGDPHVLDVDPVGLMNFTDPSKGGKLRNYQGACRSMGRR